MVLFTQGAVHTGCCSHRVLFTQGAVHTGCSSHRVLFTQGAVHTGCSSHRVLFTQGAVHTGCCSHRVQFTQGAVHTAVLIFLYLLAPKNSQRDVDLLSSQSGFWDRETCSDQTEHPGCAENSALGHQSCSAGHVVLHELVKCTMQLALQHKMFMHNEVVVVVAVFVYLFIYSFCSW